MNALVKRSMLTEHEICRYLTEASTLGLRPGEWPEQLDVEPGFGNGQPLLRYHTRGTVDFIEFVLYRQGNGSIEVRVFND